MKNKIKKSSFLSSVTAVILSATVMLGCSSCGKKNESVSSESTAPKEEPSIRLNTVHGGEARETDDYIVKDRSTEYVILISQNATDKESKAASVVQKFFYESTGILLPIKSDSENIDGIKAFSIGKTKLAEKNGISYDEDSASGFKIDSAAQSIFLTGGSNGMVYGAYELMSQLFNFDYFGEYDYYIEKNVRNLKYYQFAITEIPDIEYRLNYVAGTARFGNDPMFVDAMRITEDIIFGFSGVHNSYSYVPWYLEDSEAQAQLGEYYTSNYREWFSNTWYTLEGCPAQLCYSRYADEFYPLALKNAKEQVAATPDKNILTFINQDNTMWCECDTCLAHKEKYGSVSADYIIFLNRLADDVNAWAKQEYGRDVKILGMAYHASEAAPTVYNSKTDEYEPSAPEVKFSENLYIEYAPHNADYQIPFDAAGNEKDIKALRSWSALSNRVFMWTYSQAEYSNYFMFYDNFSSMQRNYQLMTKYRVMYILEQGQWDNEKSSAFNNLRAYLAYKLAWNCQVDYQGLIDKYFDHVFGDASEEMRAMFDFLRSYYMMLHDTKVIDSRFYQYVKSNIYPVGVVEFLKGKIDEAFKAIEPLKDRNAEQYEKLYDNILLESMFVRYVDIELYDGNAATDDELVEIKKAFKADCTKLGITKHGEARSIDLLYERWGI